MEFAKRLKLLRLQHGLTQQEMAELLNMTNQNYGRFETQNANPKIATLIKIAQIFNVTVDYLLGVDETTTETEEGKQITATYWNKQLAPEFQVEYKNDYYIITACKDMKTGASFNELTEGSIIKINAGETLKVKANYFSVWLIEVQKIIDDLIQKRKNIYFKNAFRTTWLAERTVMNLLEKSFSEDKLTPLQKELLSNEIFLQAAPKIIQLTEEFNSEDSNN